jgi:hypothetical protein
MYFSMPASEEESHVAQGKLEDVHQISELRARVAHSDEFVALRESKLLVEKVGMQKIKESSTLGGEEQLAVGLPVGLGVLEVDRVEAAADGAGRLVSSEDTLARGGDRALQFGKNETSPHEKGAQSNKKE